MTIEKFNSYTQPANTNFTILNNDLVRSSDLSAKAFKLLCIGLSHASHWSFNKKQIETCFKEGRHTVDEAMKELRTLGYLHLKAKKLSDGRLKGHYWFWFHSPISEEEFKIFLRNTDFPGFGNHGTRESSTSENPGDIRRTNPKKTKEEPPLTPPNDLPKKIDHPRPVVVSSHLESIPDLPSNLAQKLTADFTEEQIAHAVRVMQSNEAYIEKPYGWLRDCIEQGWEAPNCQADEVEKRKEIIRDKFSHLDGRRVGPFLVTVGQTYIEFDAGGNTQVRRFDTDQKGFEQHVRKFVDEVLRKSQNRFTR